jgi:hypothetical protein
MNTALSVLSDLLFLALGLGAFAALGFCSVGLGVLVGG